MRPASSPCKSCPYRQDVPSGVWAEEEYAKLPNYDKPTGEQPPSVFMCHQQNDLMCAGWVGTHDMDETLAFRIAVIRGAISADDAEAIAEYVSPVPLFESGEEAASHGLADVEQPGEDAVRVIQRLARDRQPTKGTSCH